MTTIRFKWTLAIVIVLASVFAWAGKPWQEAKPYTEWTEEDIRLIFTKSPWVQNRILDDNIVFAGKAKPVYEAQDGTRVPRNLPPQHGPGQPGQAGNPPNRPVPDWDRRTTLKPTSGRAIKTSVIWLSAVTMRQALVRMGQLRAKNYEVILAQHPEHQAPVYEIIVLEAYEGNTFSGVDLFADLDQADLREAAYLETSRGKKRMAAIRFEKAARSFSMGRFYFPRELEGAPWIVPGEKIRFFCKTRHGKLKVEFDLPAMVRDGQPDF